MLGFGQHDKQQFEKLVSPHLDALYATALKLTGQASDAEDLVQETVCRGYRYLKQFEAGTNFKAWIFTILHHQFVNTYRRTKRHEAPLPETSDTAPAAADSVDWDDTPEMHALWRDQHQQVMAALEQLPVDYKTVVLLADLQEFTYKEIADMLHIPVGTVMSRLFRARKQLYQRLQVGIGAADNTINLQTERQKRAAGQR